ncbi:unnamed protein product [Clavelina lepadiformis]|uniref:Flavin-containing monooxygenase n=3 Tax=Clavelina lepadiformis TaxID=159417 RepID=A0ABP0GDH2_CLALP
MAKHFNRVCIIGAGASGLTSTKACLEQGIRPTCLEKTSDLGGMWNNAERIKHNISPTLYPSLIANLSKVVSSFSDFPIPKDWPPYLSKNMTLDYFRMYAENFSLTQHIQFNTEVIKVFPSKSYDVSGSWIVRTKDLITNDVDEKEYSAIIVATGKHAKKFYANVPGLDATFNGEVIHAGDYINQEIFRDKSVLVIGSGSTGCDIACEAASTAKNVFLSARHGTWLTPRLQKKGLPFDVTITNRFRRRLHPWMPSWIVNRRFQNILESRVNHEACGLKSMYPPTSRLVVTTINDNLPMKIYSGQVKTRPDIKRITENHATFTNGAKDEVDVIVMATGYTTEFPFLSDNVFPGNLEKARLHKWIFPFELQHISSLTFIGIFPAGSGAITMNAELQARFVSQVLTGRKQLPSKESMQNTWKKSRDVVLQNTGGRFAFKVLIVLFSLFEFCRFCRKLSKNSLYLTYKPQVIIIFYN